MFNRILIALGIRKKVVPDTHVVDKRYPQMKNGSTYGKLGATSPLYPTSRTQVPPKAPPIYPVRHTEPGASIVHIDISGRTSEVVIEDFQAKGGEFGGAGASGSWDSPSTSSSDTSNSGSE